MHDAYSGSDLAQNLLIPNEEQIFIDCTMIKKRRNIIIKIVHRNWDTIFPLIIMSLNEKHTFQN